MADGDEAWLPLRTGKRGCLANTSRENRRIVYFARKKNVIVHGQRDIGPANYESVAGRDIRVVKALCKEAPHRNEQRVGLLRRHRYFVCRVFLQGFHNGYCKRLC
jgi:hypothetical protein